jgi:hypothetical protein
MLRIDVQRLYKISVGRFDGKGFCPFVVYESFQNEQGAVIEFLRVFKRSSGLEVLAYDGCFKV